MGWLKRAARWYAKDATCYDLFGQIIGLALDVSDEIESVVDTGGLFNKTINIPYSESDTATLKKAEKALWVAGIMIEGTNKPMGLDVVDVAMLSVGVDNTDTTRAASIVLKNPKRREDAVRILRKNGIGAF